MYRFFSLGIVKNYSKGLYRDILGYNMHITVKAIFMSKSVNSFILKLAILINALVFCGFIHSKIFAYPQTQKEPHLRINDLNTLTMFTV